MSLAVPTAAELLDWSEVLPDTVSVERLERLRVRAIAYVEGETWRRPLDSVPAELAAIAGEAVQLRAEQLYLRSRADAVTAQVNAGGIQSFSVPGYSETRATRSTSARQAETANEFDALWELIVLLMTPERRAEYTAALREEDAPAIGFADLALPDREF